VLDVRQTMSFDRSRRSLTLAEEFTFATVIVEVQELSDRLGRFQDIECRSLKAGLAEIEYKNTGRVLLSDFYREGLNGVYLFDENSDYLRRLGALDESDPKHPSVIIPNYLASQANCLASNSFHSVCCIDECEDLMAHLEQAIEGPSAAPHRIAELVSGLRSDTVDAPRKLSASLLSRLGDIAEHHDGVVPLHGRLFSQWMHHAYPLECPYPHESGTMSPLSPDEWMQATGLGQVQASRGHRLQHIEEKEAVTEAKSEALPWTVQEELVVHSKLPQAKQGGQAMWRELAALMAVVALAASLLRLSGALLTKSVVPKSEKCMV